MFRRELVVHMVLSTGYTVGYMVGYCFIYGPYWYIDMIHEVSSSMTEFRRTIHSNQYVDTLGLPSNSLLYITPVVGMYIIRLSGRDSSRQENEMSPTYDIRYSSIR